MTQIQSIQEINEEMRQRVQAAVLASLPPEKWDQLIQGAMEKFFAEPPKYHGRAEPSPFQKLVHQVAEEIVRQRVQEILVKDFETRWDTNLQTYVNNNLTRVLVEAAPAMVAAMFNDSARALVQSMVRP